MEMCYDGALVMPSSYAVMNEEEMTYVDGGNGWWNADWFIAGAIDVLISVIPAIAAINELCKVGKLARMGRTYLRENIGDALRRCGIAVAATCLTAIVNIVLTVVGFSIGGAIAWAIDGLDGNRNGYCFG